MASFKVLKVIPISHERNLVISENDDGNMVLAQQLVIDEPGRRPTKMFLKNALIIDKDDIEDVLEATIRAGEEVLDKPIEILSDKF